MAAPTMARAAGGGTIYVDDASGAGCSDSGSGTQAVPFCSIQSGVDAAVAGDTVLVEDGYYNDTKTITISNTGTAAAPITIESSDPRVNMSQMPVSISTSTMVPAFTFSNASYVTVSGFDIGTDGGEAALIGGSTHVTVDSLFDVEGNADSAPVIHVTGTSSDVTLSRNDLGNTSGHQQSILVDSGSSGDVITTNYVSGWSGGIVVNGGVGTDITGNTVATDCNQGIVLSGASTGSYIENNVVTQVESNSDNSNCPVTSAPLVAMEVDSGATSGTTLDYNVVYPLGGAPNYTWAGNTYTDQPSFNAATGQGAHDIDDDPGYTTPEPLSSTSNLIDSANADAPGELSTDLLGNARVDDPLVENTGAGSATYYDRGAAEYEDPMVPAVTMDSQTGSAPATVTATESVGTHGWATPTSWTIDFGDGSAAKTTSTPSAVPHTYTTAGTYTVTVTANDGYGSDGRGSASTTTTERILSDSVFHPVALTRILDTRAGTGTNGVIAAVKANTALVLKIDGTSPLPASGVQAVTLNVTMTNATGHGNIDAYADGATRPSTSNINFGAGQTVANQVIAPVGKDGSIDLYNQGTGTVDLVADVAGYYATGAGLGMEPLGNPTRLLDTRKGTGTKGVIAAVPAKGTLKLTSADTDGWLSGGTTDVFNVTVTNAKAGGYLSVYTDGTTRPGTSSLNFGAGQTVANEVVVTEASDGTIDFYNNASGTVDVIADLLGMFTTAGGSGYVPISPQRLLDTRYGTGAPEAAVAPFGTVQVTVPGVDGIPSGLAAVAANVTVTGPTAGGDVEVYPEYLSSRPGVSTLNFGKGGTVANATTMTTEDTGLKLYNESPGSSELILDVFGYYQ
ncbi:MAG TPA: PKD domain-containing protein [Actinospica sp.]|nr:PKD domain-containing protein [Actinospica sp.]